MLSHIYNTAKRILSRSPSVHGRESESRETPPTSSAHDDAMVTTRRGTDTPGSEATPRSSVKTRAGKRELDVQDTPTAAKRQRKTAPKVQGKEASKESEEDAPEPSDETSDTIDVAVPKLAIRRRGSPVVIVEQSQPSTQDSAYETPTQQSSSVYATPATKRHVEGSPTPRATRSAQKGSAKKSGGKKKGLHIEVEQTTVDITPEVPETQDEIPSSTAETESTPVPSQDKPAKKAHMRFGSEEPVEPQSTIHMNAKGHKRYSASVQQVIPPPAIADSEDDASDSDEAPEVVTTTAATQKAIIARKEAIRAQEAQAEKERQKRIAREARIAQDQADKRHREELKAKKAASKAAKEAKKQNPEEQQQESTPTTFTVFKPTSLPALLPTSLLSTLPDHRAPTPDLEPTGPTPAQLHEQKLNRHIKFLERTDKGIKDVKKGKLSVSVLGQGNKVLAPKGNRDTRNVRERWLKGRSVEKKGKKGMVQMAKSERRAFGNKGFLRDD